MEYRWLRIKIPPTLRVNFVTPRSLGDSPAAKITRPKNLAQPSGVMKVGDKQYTVSFNAGSANETVDVVLSSGVFNASSLLAIFTLTLWLSLLPGRDFFRTFSFKTFISRTLVFTGLMFVILVSLEVMGISVHKPFSRWLNTLEMAERSGDAIKGLFGKIDPFFTSQEADDFYSRTGSKLEKRYLMTMVSDEKTKYRMLVRKEFFPADDLDSAEDICEKELSAVIPVKTDYDLILKGEDLRSNMNFSFAEWTSTGRGILSDDYQLFILPEHVSTWQISVAEIKGTAGSALTEMANTYGLQRSDMDDADLREAMIKNINKELRLPAETDVVYKDSVASFFLDADSQANFRCIRKLQNEE